MKKEEPSRGHRGTGEDTESISHGGTEARGKKQKISLTEAQRHGGRNKKYLSQRHRGTGEYGKTSHRGTEARQYQKRPLD